MNKYWTKEGLETVIKDAKTIREVLQHFGLPSNQGYYNKIFHKSVKEFNIDISHIIDGAKTQLFRKKIPLEELLVEGQYRDTNSLKKRLLKENVLENKCSECGQKPEWNGKPLVLQLDHINGDNTDNRLENLRILCPHCHSQTETWGGRNAQEKHTHKYVCKTCGGPKKYTKSENCKKCEDLSRKENTKIKWPSKEIVLQMAQEIGFSATGRKLSVSDNAVRKFLKRS